ncbi:hypothetical protein AVEN_226344-1 [Araneus ventricosus]|uniref:Uncharacterized protein n=1 Tax=Araneus ventricosus TaxID=182803 RepID=A0A4Y2IMD3_ARAVE|nr:hypothetical protein AVEN_226344-1 [Araneus ventricosus]
MGGWGLEILLIKMKATYIPRVRKTDLLMGDLPRLACSLPGHALLFAQSLDLSQDRGPMIYSGEAEEIRPGYAVFTIPKSTGPQIRYQIKYTADVCDRSATSIFVSGCDESCPGWIYANSRGTKTVESEIPSMCFERVVNEWLPTGKNSVKGKNSKIGRKICWSLR